METIEITRDLAQSILDYLAQRPFQEVNGLIAEIQSQAELSQTRQQMMVAKTPDEQQDNPKKGKN